MNHPIRPVRPKLLAAALLATAFLATALRASAQMTRERAPDRVAEEVFWAPSVVSTASVTNVPRGNLNATILHTFGPASSGASELWGLDGSANIRFGVDYGLTDDVSIGIGRSRIEKVYDLRVKGSVARQSGGSPLEVAVKGDLGITTEKNGFEFGDRLSWFGSVLLARRLSDRFAVQVSPMVSHVASPAPVATPGGLVAPRKSHVAVGLVARWELSNRFALLVEYVPVVSSRTPGTTDAMAVGLDIETGGHVFQLFAATSRYATEQFTVARNVDDFLDGDFRFGFNVNRVFAPGR